MRCSYAGRKVMLGVDRLDMIKGIPQKLLAFEKFLHEHPEWRDKVLLVQVRLRGWEVDGLPDLVRASQHQEGPGFARQLV